MIEVSDYANEKLYQTLSSRLGRRKSYGSPPVFYWFRNVISEINSIDTYPKIGIGEHQYNMANSLGVVYFSCEYANNQRIIIVTDFKFNTRAINNWQGLKSKNVGITPQNNQSENNKAEVKYQPLNRSLFGYRYVKDKNNGCYNLLNKEGKLITQWFSDIRPKKQPYGKYNIIAYINIRGQAYALGLDGQTYSMNREWKELYSESKRLRLRRLIENMVRQVISEIR